MCSNYLIYPEAEERIKNSPIEQRIRKLEKSEEGLPYLRGYSFGDEVRERVLELKRNGYYEQLPKGISKKYKKIMNEMFEENKKHKWNVKRPEGEVNEDIEMDGVRLFSGEIASSVLKPDEIWDCKKFGFEHPVEFAAAVSAYIFNRYHSDGIYRKGYRWTTKRQNSAVIVSEITGSEHCDLRIFQIDIAPYETISPFGNPILMRPRLDADYSIIAGYHSTECMLLVSLLKYIEQQKIPNNIFADDGTYLANWIKSIDKDDNPFAARCAEHYSPDYTNPLHFFIGYDAPIPQLNSEGEAEKHTIDWVCTDSEGIYRIYVSPNKELIFSYQTDKDADNPKKQISAMFLPEDAEHLVKGLLYQSAKMLGRTSLRQLIDILAYRFSEQFERDMKKYKIKR